MSDWPAPARADHLNFCRIEGWTEVRNARGRTGSHHVTLQFGLPDGRVLRTRISHPADSRSDGYGPSMWRHILVDQLAVTEAEFWECVRHRNPPARGRGPDPEGALPADLVHLLRTRARLSDTEIADLSKHGAIEVMRRIWAE